eukprot:maker-scaffold_5-snap-gene-5.59-mRNA-1 protein AED:0.00 eAED:0.00 QI:257/1/1/1/1/1/3/207/532
MFPCCAICANECGCKDNRCVSNTEKACYGDSNSTFCNIFLAPFALCLHFIYAYVISCSYIYISRCLNHTFCFLCVHQDKCQSCYLYNDKKFPANQTSLGEQTASSSGSAAPVKAEMSQSPEDAAPADLEQGQKDGEIFWKRATEIFSKSKPVLFEDDAAPSDVVHGSQSHNWLTSALVCMAEFPSLVDKVFITREYSYRGKYKVRLYNDGKNEWEYVTVDDFLPLKKTAGKKAGDLEDTQFVFAEAQGNELWVAILEKAFAKFRGSYAALKGGNVVYAFRCLTGDFVFRYVKDTEQGKYVRHQLDHVGPKEAKPFKVTKDQFSHDKTQMFSVLQEYDRKRGLIAASAGLSDESNQPKDAPEKRDEKTGLVKGLSYSVLEVKRVGKGMLGAMSGSKEFELLKLRNPWGNFEWKGDWSDDSDMWEKYPKVKKALKPDNVKGDDGTFWMSFDDFFEHFDTIDLCDRTVNYQDFHLNVHERAGRGVKHAVGPLQGCMEGFYDFCLKCQGIRYLYFGNKTKYKPKQAKRKARDDGLI